jgi:hypothetical protein
MGAYFTRGEGVAAPRELFEAIAVNAVMEYSLTKCVLSERGTSSIARLIAARKICWKPLSLERRGLLVAVCVLP